MSWLSIDSQKIFSIMMNGYDFTLRQVSSKSVKDAATHTLCLLDLYAMAVIVFTPQQSLQT